MNSQPASVIVVHNKVPARIRVRVPIIRNRQTFADLLKQGLLRDPRVKGIYHAEPSIVTGTVLIKFHPAVHTEEEVLAAVQRVVNSLVDGTIEISAKHKDPRLGKMHPGAFFTRELLVSIAGNVLAGLVLAGVLSR